MTSITVQAEVDLFDISASQLVEALVQKRGKEEALSLVMRCDVKQGRAYLDEADDELTELRKRLRAALELIERGKAEEGMHAIRMLAAETTNLLTWQRIKEGKHPFLSFPVMTEGKGH